MSLAATAVDKTFPTAASGPVLACTGLQFRIGGLQIIEDLHFHSNAGEICGVVGPNGSGKTTFLNLVSGFIKPQAGSVFMSGVEITGLSSHSRAERGIGRTFQQARGVQESTAVDNAALGLYRVAGRRLLSLKTRRRMQADARTALQRTAVGEFADWPLKYLSYGSQKKVELARAIVSRPDLLLVDEPSAGVSIAHVREFERVLVEEAARGCSVVVVDHDLDFVSRIASRVVVLDVGRAIFEGTPEKAFADPAVVQAYIGTPDDGTTDADS